MKKSFGAIVFSSLLTLGATAAHPAADVRKLDVQGVKLGMKVEEVKKALKVTDAPQQFSDGTSRIYIERPDGWSFSADFLPEALGGGVFIVNFRQRLDNVPPEALVTAVQSKYGKPDDVKFDPGYYGNITREAKVSIVYGAELATIQKLKFPKELTGPMAGQTFEDDFITLRFNAEGKVLKRVWVQMKDGPALVAHRKAVKLAKEREASNDAQQKATTIKF